MTKPRTDLHRPGALIPEDYRFRLAFIYGGSQGEPAVNMDLLARLRREHKFFDKSNGSGGCDICGTHFMHGVVFEHIPTGEHIVAGWICADKLEMLDQEAFAARRLVLSERERIQRRRDKWAHYRAAGRETVALLRTNHGIAQDMRGRFLVAPERGLSEKQINLLQKLACEARDPRVEVPKVRCPYNGERVEVEGRVISEKEHFSDYGESWKMTVVVSTPQGEWLTWGTIPSSMLNRSLKGATVRFTATITRSNRDEHFSFFKRPSKTTIVAEPAKVAA